MTIEDFLETSKPLYDELPCVADDDNVTEWLPGHAAGGELSPAQHSQVRL